MARRSSRPPFGPRRPGIIRLYGERLPRVGRGRTKGLAWSTARRALGAVGGSEEAPPPPVPTPPHLLWHGVYVLSDWQPPLGGGGQAGNIRANLLADAPTYVDGARVQAAWDNLELLDGVVVWNDPLRQNLDQDMADIAVTLGKMIHVTWGTTSKVKELQAWLQALLPMSETYVKQDKPPPSLWNLTLGAGFGIVGTSISVTAPDGNGSFVNGNVDDMIECVQGPNRGGRLLITARTNSNTVTATVKVAFVTDTLLGGADGISEWSIGEWGVLPWSSTYTTYFKRFVKAHTRHYGSLYGDKIPLMSASGVGGSNEIAITGGPIKGLRSALRIAQGLSVTADVDDQIFWAYRAAWLDMVEFFMDLYPDAIITLVPGTMPLSVGDAGAAISNELALLWGKRIGFFASAFSAAKTGFNYQMQQVHQATVVLGGQTEEPSKTSEPGYPDGDFSEANPAYPVRPGRETVGLGRAIDHVAMPLGYRVIFPHGDALGLDDRRGRPGGVVETNLKARWVLAQTQLKMTKYP